MRVNSAESTELFTGPAEEPWQLVRVTYAQCGAPTRLLVDGPGLETVGEVTAVPGDGAVEVPVRVADGVVGERRAARVRAAQESFDFDFVVAEAGWTMHMVSHFHYDPVWWNTQAAYTSQWTEDPPGRCRQTNGFELVSAHLETARREPEYKFVLAEVDYLKPYWDTRPEDRADLRRLIAEGRVEVMGGTYNEPNTNLTNPETAIRNFVHGIGFQRDVMGADPATAWQLDVFGHDPQFPGMAADAGLTSSSWARGPHHQWGPMADDGDPERMQFASEFEWVAPSGRGLLTHYMPAHYAAGWWMDSAASLEEAERATYALFANLKKVALTRNVLLPVGTDYTPPNKWVTEIHRDWAARYTWPRFVCAIPSDFFTAVRAELDERGATASPQTRDMNPIYTGCHVSYIDTKQANRAAENAVLEAERFAVFAGLLTGARYPEAALAKAWVQLAYGAHHDAITGSESDQVYLDLLTGWRDAWELGRTARDNSLALLSSAVDGAVVVWNPLAHSRTDVVTMHLDEPLVGGLRDADDREVSVLVEDGGHTVSWLARDVPSLGWRAYRFEDDGAASGWEPLDGNGIGNEHYRLTVDPERGGGVDSLRHGERELITPGRVGNELAVYDEYPAHPKAGEGPWHLLPKGPVTSSASRAADSVSAYRNALGERLVVCGGIPGLLDYTQTITLWHGVDRVDCRTVVDGFTGEDRLLRLRWPCAVPGAMPVSEVGDAVIGRGFGLTHRHGDPDEAVDTAEYPYTLDNPAYGWFGLSSTVKVLIGSDGGATDVRAISVAEVVHPGGASDALARQVMVALVRAGVTATCTTADRARYGDLAVDSNLPDVRISLGGPDENAFSAAVLAGREVGGTINIWIPADAPLAEVWEPGADLRGVRALPVLVVRSSDGLEEAVGDLCADLAYREIYADGPVSGNGFDDRTVAVFNRGVPSFAVDSDGTLHTSLMRSCTGWPSGTWIDPPRRTAPDGSNFQLQHWTHTFDYAVAAGDGDWRDSEIPSRSAEFGQPLLSVQSHHVTGTGGLPPWGSLLEVEPAKRVALGALKAAGNPTAHGSAAHADPATGVSVRLVESVGHTSDVAVHSGLRAVIATDRLDLLEQPTAGRADALRLDGYEIATVRAELNLPRVLDATQTALAPDAEPAQPLYARYWLHNRGPAPLGGLPAVAHLDPRRLDVGAGEDVHVRLTVVSDGDLAMHGRVRLVMPDGWTVEPAVLPFVLPPGEYLEADLAVTMPANTVAGLYPIRAEAALTGAALPPAWRQTVEDVCVVAVGSGEDRVLRLVTDLEPVEVATGEHATLSATVATDCHAALALEAHLISPWGTWDWMGPNIIGAELPAHGSVALDFDVAPPPWTAPGEWWALVRVGCAGELVYTSAVRVIVR